MGTILACGATLLIGYSVGWVRGYEQKEQDDNRIEKEMDGFWKEAENRGVSSHPVQIIRYRAQR